MSVLKSVVRSWEPRLERLLLERLRAGLQAVVMEAVRQAEAEVEVEVEEEADMDRLRRGGEK